MTNTLNIAFTLGAALNRSRDAKEMSSQTADEFDNMCSQTFVKDLREVVEIVDLNDVEANRLFFLVSTSEEILAYGHFNIYLEMIQNMLETYTITHENKVLHVKKVITWFGQGKMAVRELSKFKDLKFTNENKREFLLACEHAKRDEEVTLEYTHLIELLTN